jgi:hypothetical protein
MTQITSGTNFGICVDSALKLDDQNLEQLQRLRRLIGIQ